MEHARSASVFHALRDAGSGGGVTEPEFLQIVYALAALRQVIHLGARPAQI